MKFLSLMQPWAWAMLHQDPQFPCLPKNIENRKWRAPANLIGQQFGIHTSRNWDPSGEQYLREGHAEGMLPKMPLRFEHGMRSGVLLGEVTLVGCVRLSDVPEDDRAPWHFGKWCWQVKDPILYANPVPWKGQVILFEVPDEVVERLRRGEAA